MHLVGFYYKNISRCAVLWMSKVGNTVTLQVSSPTAWPWRRNTIVRNVENHPPNKRASHSIQLAPSVTWLRESPKSHKDDWLCRDVTWREPELICLHRVTMNRPSPSPTNSQSTFYVLLTVHLGSVLVNNQLDAQFFFRINVFQFSVCRWRSSVLIWPSLT